DSAAHSLRLLDQDGEAGAAQREARYHSIRHAVGRMRNLMELTEAMEHLRHAQADDAPAEMLDLAAISHALREALDPANSRRVIIQENETPPLRGNARLIQVGLSNLLDNAIKYSHPDTPIYIDIGTDPHRPGAFWRIRDVGPGIPADKRDSVFERYQRLDERSGKPGLGLGLTLSRQIVERHGGQLQLELADWPHGACFAVRLPSE